MVINPYKKLESFQKFFKKLKHSCIPKKSDLFVGRGFILLAPSMILEQRIEQLLYGEFLFRVPLTQINYLKFTNIRTKFIEDNYFPIKITGQH